MTRSDMSTSDGLTFQAMYAAQAINRTRAFCEVPLAIVDHGNRRYSLIRGYDAVHAQEPKRYIAEKMTAPQLAAFIEGIKAGIDLRDLPAGDESR